MAESFKWYNPAMPSIVSLDIETTGLDLEKDAIIEIGAVRFSGRRIEGEWNSLVNPGRRIPPFITQLTGITDLMVLKEPSIQDVLVDLKNFIGDAPILGHNVRFDLGFFKKFRLFGLNDSLDTYELAAVLLPNAGRYNLAALAQALAVPLPAHHRALDDARATRGIYLRLLEEVQAMPIGLLAELIRLGSRIEWGAGFPLEEVMRSRTREKVSVREQEESYKLPIYRPGKAQPALQPGEEVYALDEDEVASVLEQGGLFARFFNQYEFRPQQVEMLRSVTRAFSGHRHLMVEAGTGTGKSMAYLVPSAMWATHNQRRVVISTNTINLQDQLINKDIPDLQEALGLDLRAAVLKGRSNYLCPRRLESLRHRGPENADEMRVLGKVLVWLQGTTSGDRSELNLNGSAERLVWQRLSAEDDACTTDTCVKRFGGGCPFYRARQAAQNAHILIVNHALLLADVATGNKVLPEYDYLVVDEAHHLEDATTNALSFHATQAEIERTLRELGGPNAGALGRILTATLGILAPDEYAMLNFLVQQATDLAFRLDTLLKRFFTSLDHFLLEQRDGREVGAYSHQQRIIPATRSQPVWFEVEQAWDEAGIAFEALADLIGKLAHGVLEINAVLEENDDDLFSTLTDLYRRFKEYSDEISALVFTPSPDRIYWVEIQSNGYRISLHSAPVHIGQLMERFLWREKASVILTSATLTTAGEFDYIRGRLNAEDAYELALGSPFDFETATLLYLVNDIAEPTDRNGYQRGVEMGLLNLCRSTGGKTLVLFTSYDQLKRTSQAIGPALAREDILVYEQGEGASAHALLENFRTTERAVLLGTRAFWEGVDIPGEALSILAIVKLPFDVPSDPIVAARSETFDDPFYQYSLPEAILRFRQGFGRLIRSQNDRGVVAVLDRRVLSKKYGHLFLDSLPPCTVSVGPLADLPRAAVRWLNL